MKFLHAADFHIGATPEAGRPWGGERANAVETALARVVDLCNSEDVDLLLIAGDLFNRVPLKRDLKEAAYQLSRLKRAKVVLIAGNHDYLKEGSFFETFDFGLHVYMLSNETLKTVEFPEYNTIIHGFSYHNRTIKAPLIDGVKAPEDGKIHILLAHGGDADHMPINTNPLSNNGFDYVALGHIHQPKMYKGTRIAYSGSPEPLDVTDIGDRGCLIGEVTKENFNLKWCPLAKTRYREETIELTPEMTEGEIKDKIKDLHQRSPLDLLIIRLKGRYSPDLNMDVHSVSGMDRVCRVIDESIPDYDLEKLLQEHKDDIIGRFITAFAGKDDETSRKALYYGLSVLL